MSVLKGTLSIVSSLVLVSAVTAVLWYTKTVGIGSHHPIFFYLLPIALVAVLYGSLPALVCAFAATASAAFLFYAPTYSLYVSGRLETGDLVCFLLLAVIAVKCTGELLRPSAKIPLSQSRGRVATMPRGRTVQNWDAS
jgi:K+-sensing histidine kinase KdpD